jgi:hypothetical protein
MPPSRPISAKRFRDLLTVAQHAVLALERKPDAQSQLDLPASCRTWLGAGVVLAFCGHDRSSDPASRLAVPAQLQISSPTMHGGSQGSIAQFSGLPLRVGDVARLWAEHAVDGDLVVLTQSGLGTRAWARFALHLAPGEHATLANSATAGLTVEITGTAVHPQQTVMVPNPGAALLPPSPNSAGPYENCAALGHTVEISDPRGDPTLPNSETRVDGAESVDIVKAALTTRGPVVCLDITTVRPPTSEQGFSLVMSSEAGAAPRINKVGIFLAGAQRLVDTTAPAVITDLPDGPAAAIIGVRRNHVSLMIDQRQFAARQRMQRFSWQVRSSQLVGPTASDCIPDRSPAPTPPRRPLQSARAPAPTAGC